MPEPPLPTLASRLPVLRVVAVPRLSPAAVAAIDELPRGELGDAALDEDPFWRLIAGVPRRV